MNSKDIAASISEKGLRVTPQRIAILGAVMKLKQHPTAEKVTDYIKKNHPNISVGTVYKVLDSLVEHELLQKVKTENGVMRYDHVQESHHHLYCKETDRIEDYADDTLDHMISDYFKSKGIKNFNINNIQLHITGTFKN